MEKSCVDGVVHIDMSEGSINKSSDSRQCRKIAVAVMVVVMGSWSHFECEVSLPKISHSN